MHPIEHLRYVARSGGADPDLLAREAASALADVARLEPPGLLPACRRLIERHLTAGPMWWLSARMLAADDPTVAARLAVSELDHDMTARHLAMALPDAVTALLVDWPELCATALRSRGDVEALIVNSAGGGAALARRLRDLGSDASVVPESGTGAAAAVCDLVLVEAVAAGSSGVLAAPGSLAAAAVASYRAGSVWAVIGVGRVLPERLWDSLLSRLDASGEEPWDRDVELVPAALLSQVVGPEGVTDVDAGLRQATCPAAPELFRLAG
jgi:hypothetical protein